MNQNGECKLCKKRAKLIRKSHIIPNFMYKGLFDSNNKIALVNLGNPSSNPKSFQTGIFEKYILCQKCENELLSRTEKYVSTVLYGGNLKSVPSFENQSGPDGVESIIVRNIDYQKFKHFVLSIVWRAAVSDNPFFDKVSLSNEEETIRNIVLNDKYTSETTFKISVMAIVNRNNDLVRIIQNPDVHDFGNCKYVTFFIGGFVYFISLSDEASFPVFEKTYLKEKGEIEIPIAKGGIAIDFLTAYGLQREIATNFIMNL